MAFLDPPRQSRQTLPKTLIPGFDSTYFIYLVTGIKVPYKDGTTEEYSLELYVHQDEGEVAVWYQPKAGRYGVLEANQKRISIFVLDNSGKGLFNDSDEVILLDIDGQIDVGHQDDTDRKLYSVLELPGGKIPRYRN